MKYYRKIQKILIIILLLIVIVSTLYALPKYYIDNDGVLHIAGIISENTITTAGFVAAGVTYSGPLSGIDYQIPLTAGVDYQIPLTVGVDYQAPLIAGTNYLTPTGSAAGLTSWPTITVGIGGTGMTSYVLGDLLTAITTTQLGVISKGTSTNAVLGKNSAGVIDWYTSIALAAPIPIGTGTPPVTEGYPYFKTDTDTLTIGTGTTTIALISNGQLNSAVESATIDNHVTIYTTGHTFQINEFSFNYKHILTSAATHTMPIIPATAALNTEFILVTTGTQTLNTSDATTIFTTITGTVINTTSPGIGIALSTPGRISIYSAGSPTYYIVTADVAIASGETYTEEPPVGNIIQITGTTSTYRNFSQWDVSKMGIQFTPSSSGTITQVVVRLSDPDGGDNNFRACLYNNSGGLPSAIVGTCSGNVNQNAIGATEQDVTFTGMSAAFTASTIYYMVIEDMNAFDGYGLRWYYTAAPSYTNITSIGNVFTYTTSWVSDAAYTLKFTGYY